MTTNIQETNTKETKFKGPLLLKNKHNDEVILVPRTDSGERPAVKVVVLRAAPVYVDLATPYYTIRTSDELKDKYEVFSGSITLTQ